MKITWYKIIFELIKEILVGLITSLVKGSNHIKCVLLRNQKCMAQPTTYSY